MGWVRFPVGSHRRLTVLAVCPASCSALMGGCKGSFKRGAETCHQCSIHCESTRVAHGASKWRWALQTHRDTPKGTHKSILTRFSFLSTTGGKYGKKLLDVSILFFQRHLKVAQEAFRQGSNLSDPAFLKLHFLSKMSFCIKSSLIYQSTVSVPRGWKPLVV